MRYHFPNLDRPKKAAKRITKLLAGIPLSTAQDGLAVALGYRDWHDFERFHSALPPAPLDQTLPYDKFVRRAADLAIRLATAIGVSDGEAQYALAASRLTGDLVSLDDQFAVRLLIWKARGLWPSSGMAGTVVRAPARFAGPRKLAMLTANFDRDAPVQVVTDNRGGACVREEITIPRTPLAPFLPHRLRLAYGVWTEADGAKVLFSRDYAPIWRLRDGMPPEAILPAEWIKHVRQEWFWSDANAPWGDRGRIAEEEARLASYGALGLPLLVDALPVMVSSVGNVPSPRRIVEDMRQSNLAKVG